jgi:hypothetical protein
MLDSKVELLNPNYRTAEEIDRDVEEVRIKVSWGFLAGKWWGPKNIQPILTIHGWQGRFEILKSI